jgi:hypothetical protein
MKQTIAKFLEFNGKNLVFLSENGIYHVAIKPVCEGIGVDFIRQFKNLKEDSILGPKLSKQTIMVPGSKQPRKFICLPEKYIYGYIFSIKSDSEALLAYKEKCYELLYDFFHGALTQRKGLIREKAEVASERSRIEMNFKSNADFLRWESLKAAEARIGKDLKNADTKEFNEQLDMFRNNS